ncbi:TMEM175 family protein [Hymenobacter volaticus]|uniref:TMEM175 family protein n=1 Tax=Hymenobacter volaticus TaxID=2932254 RepID=A0ABY4G667_9BACT|nr:TMEM175 family protein [Hymenobacter volaticus]UOQ66009.1 TMEM175 family protein [Hymenobacter volaticus]
MDNGFFGSLIAQILYLTDFGNLSPIYQCFMDGNENAQHNREAFQLERLMLFTDAVFAIAITLLAIELKVPELHHPTEHAALKGLAILTPRFVGFFLSFFIIAIYWLAHHRIYRFVIRATPRLLWLNILFLLSIVLMPFTTAYQSEYVMLRTPWVLYATNILLIGFVQVRMQFYLRSSIANVVHPIERQHPDLDPVRPMLSPFIFLFSISLGFMPIAPPWLLRMTPTLLAPVFYLYQRRYRRLEREYKQQVDTQLT